MDKYKVGDEVDAKIEEMAKNYGEKQEMFRNNLKPEDVRYFEEEIKVQKIKIQEC